MSKNISFKYIVFTILLVTIVSCNKKNDKEANITFDTGGELDVVTGSDTNPYSSENNNEYPINQGGENSDPIPVRAPDTGTANLEIESPGGGTGNAGSNGFSLPDGTIGTSGVDVGTTQSSGPNSQDTGQSNNLGSGTTIIDYGDNSEQINDFNILVIAFFFLFISIFLLKISSESWLSYKWYKNEEFLKNKRIEYDNEIEQLIKMMEFGERPELRPKEYFENLNKEIQRIQSKKDNFRSNERFPEFSFHQISSKNVLIGFLSIAFFIIYYNFLSTYNHNLNPRNYNNFLNFLFINNKFFIFPLLIISSYFSAISLFRFTLIQGSNNNNSKNKFSFFGLIVSLITLSGAIITISKFIIG